MTNPPPGGEPDTEAFALEPSTTGIGPLDPARCLSWLGHRTRRPAVVAWPVILLPDFVAGAGALPTDSVEVYQKVRWVTEIPDGPLEARVTPRWARPRGDRTEFGVTTGIWAGGLMVAASDIVCLTGVHIESFGSPELPPPPDPGVMDPVRQLTIGEDEVREYSAASHASYLVTSGPTTARGLGFRNALVPGPMLTTAHLAAEPLPPAAGTIEVWFLRPVTAGSAVELCAGTASWCLRSVGSCQLATISLLRRLGLEGGGQAVQA